MKEKFGLLLLAMMLSVSAPALATWTAPVPVTEVNIQPGEDWSPFLSFDGLSLYFSRVRTDDFYYGRIYEATRSEPTGPFTSVREISELNRSDTHVLAPWVSPDNLRMYYQTQESARWSLRMSERASVDDPWPTGTSIDELNSLGTLLQVPRLTPDELTIFFGARDMSGGEGGQDIWMATRTDRNSPFENVVNLREINTAAHEVSSFPSTDGLMLYFASDRNGDVQLFKASRESTSDPFGVAEHLSLFDLPGGHSNFPAISADGTALYFMGQSAGASTRDIYVSYIPEPATLLLLGLGAMVLRARKPRKTP
ncbi:MAG: PD40 domain-containing protein [Sedimentisphaerales bacterium]|nr:PD40 domain-containing protein [Sedimentisphaerales bacterium]